MTSELPGPASPTCKSLRLLRREPAPVTKAELLLLEAAKPRTAKLLLETVAPRETVSPLREPVSPMRSWLVQVSIEPAPVTSRVLLLAEAVKPTTAKPPLRTAPALDTVRALPEPLLPTRRSPAQVKTEPGSRTRPLLLAALTMPKEAAFPAYAVPPLVRLSAQFPPALPT